MAPKLHFCSLSFATKVAPTVLVSTVGTTLAANPLRKLFAAILGISATLYILFAATIYFRQDEMIFVGSKLPDDHQFSFDLPFEELTIPVDGARLSGLHFIQENPHGLIFFLHGNGGDLESWTTNAEYYRRINYDMFMIDYRGYGKSTGEIQSEAQLHSDVRTVWDAVAPQYGKKPIVIYGRSLGTAVATELARHVRNDILILVSPFTSLAAMAKEQYPLMPSWLLRFPLKTDEVIGEVQSPIVFVHGDRDAYIPIAHSEQLLEMTNAPSKLLIIDGAGHNDIHQFKRYLEGLAAELPGIKDEMPVLTP